jgi:hypothetical protein
MPLQRQWSQLLAPEQGRHTKLNILACLRIGRAAPSRGLHALMHALEDQRAAGTAAAGACLRPSSALIN